MTPEQLADMTTHRFSRFLSAYPPLSPERRLRIVAMKACLTELGVDRVSQLTDPETIEALASALTVPYLPGNEKPAELCIESTTGYSMERVNMVSERSGESVSACIAFFEGKSWFWDADLTIEEMQKEGIIDNPIAARRAYYRIKTANAAIEEVEAEERGELWQIRAALYEGESDILIYNGFACEEADESHEHLHDKALAFVTHKAIGNSREARAEAARFFSSVDTTIHIDL